MNILITGSRGNVGKSVCSYLDALQVSYYTSSRNHHNTETYRILDFEKSETFENALQDIDAVFLVRPPELTDVKGIFEPFIDACKKQQVKHIVFLSLLGVEKNPFPPHHKIEKYIEASGMPYTFIRPSFFMQNLIEPHGKEIIELNEIFIPSGKAKISFIDAKDIGEIIARCLLNEEAKYQKYTITGKEAIDYYEVAEHMSRILKRKIIYSNPSLLKFRKKMIRNGLDKTFANVMMVLYLTTRMGMAKDVTSTAKTLLGRDPRTIEMFIDEHKEIWQ
ncbi:MAG: SDR family oxidoreductase [Clostridia bacterium]|nr:SDR family oxidoreductase [Clostridia bacterium]